MPEDLPVDKNTENFERGYLALPFQEGQFKEFVMGLLGKPQTITKSMFGNFEMHLEDIKNFHELLHQRIAQQNNGTLVQFKAQVYYSDKSHVTLSGIYELLSYKELKDVISQGIRLTWIYLIQFTDKTVPEKQEIELLILTSPYIVEDVGFFERQFNRSGEIRIIINHTARSWGYDIETLLTHQIQSLFTQDSVWLSLVSKNRKAIAVLISYLFFYFSCFGLYNSAIAFRNSESLKAKSFISDPINDINEKLNYLLNYTATNIHSFFIMRLLLMGFVIILFAIIVYKLVERLAFYNVRSHLILTKRDEKFKERLHHLTKERVILFAVSLVISISTGVLSNYLFTWLSNR